MILTVRLYHRVESISPALKAIDLSEKNKSRIKMSFNNSVHNSTLHHSLFSYNDGVKAGLKPSGESCQASPQRREVQLARLVKIRVYPLLQAS